MSTLLQSSTILIVNVFVIFLFMVLFTVREKEVLLPWKIVFTAVLLITFEEVLRIASELGWYTQPIFIIGFVDLIVVGLFIYTILLKLESLKVVRG